MTTNTAHVFRNCETIRANAEMLPDDPLALFVIIGEERVELTFYGLQRAQRDAIAAACEPSDRIGLTLDRTPPDAPHRRLHNSGPVDRTIPFAPMKALHLGRPPTRGQAAMHRVFEAMLDKEPDERRALPERG